MTAPARRAQRDHTYLGGTQAVCPTCRRVVGASRLLRDGKVYLRRHCPEHGAHEALVSGDAEWTLAAQAFARPGWLPQAFSTPVREGCPHDCGLCPDHEQHSCLPIIEITDHCDLGCPICLVSNGHRSHLSREAFAAVIEGLVRKEGALDNVALSGGEPTLHPELLELLDLATRPEIARVSLLTNGRRLAADPELCRALARRRVYVSLQFDGFDEAALARLRGPGEHASVKRRALENLEAAGVSTALAVTVARGVNEGAVGEALRLLYEKDFLLSVVFQPAAYVGTGACFAPHDPLDVVTLPEVVRACEAQGGGRLRRADFLPLPCSHPSCFALTYLLRTGDGFVPLPRFVALDRFLRAIANRGTLPASPEMEEAMRAAIDDLWSSAGQIPESRKILGALRAALDLTYPAGGLDDGARQRVGERLVKSIFIHAFMDPHTFDVERVRKCCTHYALPDGRLVPGCVHNVLRRQEAR